MSVMIAGATVAVGVYSGYQANKASKRALSAQQQANADSVRLAEEQLDFQKEVYDEQLARYDEWRNIYGPIEENLADFYTSLTPDLYASVGLEYNQEEFTRQKESTMQTLAQRGLISSGVAADVEKQMNLKNSQERAKIRRDAPFKVAEAQSGFLSQGRGGPTYGPQGTNVANAMQGIQNAVVGGQENIAAIEGANAQSLWSSAGSMLSTGLNYYQRNRLPSPSAADGSTAPLNIDVPSAGNIDISFTGGGK